MDQQDLFGVYALCLGVQITYTIDWTHDSAEGLFTATPMWSKKPRKSGDVRLRIDEASYDCVPDLAYHAARGVSRTDPGDYIPYYCKRQLKHYQNTEH